MKLKLLAFFVFCLVLAGLAFLPFQVPRVGDSLRMFLDSLHYPAVAVLSWAMHRLALGLRLQQPLLLAMAGALALVLLVEVLQQYLGRVFSYQDMLLGLAGILAYGLLLLIARLRARYAFFTAGLLGLLTVVVSAEASRALLALQQRQASLPMLGDFETPSQGYFWRSQGWRGSRANRLRHSEEYHSAGQRSLKVESYQRDWSGVRFDAGDMDWRPYQGLAFDIYYPAIRPLILHLRIDDASEDSRRYSGRFNQRLELKSGWNHFTIPMEQILNGPRRRQMDLQHIRQIYLFAGLNAPPHRYFLDNVRLH